MTRVAPHVDGGRPHNFRYLLDDRSIMETVGRTMAPDVADLLDVCAAIYLVDRQAERSPRGDVRPSNEQWPRRFEDVVIPVRQPTVWAERETRDLLETLLTFVSDDDWSGLRFVPRSTLPRPAEGQPMLLPPRPLVNAVTVLNSGGLDSLLGLLETLRRNPTRVVQSVSVVTNGRVWRIVSDVLAELRRLYPGSSLHQSRLHIRLSHIGRPQDDRESSQRTRGLLFLASGLAATVMSGGGLLQVTENGPGAINLPGTADQLGARVTRVMHPKTLRLFEKLASRVLNRQMNVVNTGVFRTKRELVGMLLDPNLTSAVHLTVSCDRLPYLKQGMKGCGICGSCLYRRIALHAQGRENLDDELYEVDLLDATRARTQRIPSSLISLRELNERLATLLAAPDPFLALDVQFATVDDVVASSSFTGLPDAEVGAALVRLFRAQVEDVSGFLGFIARQGLGHQAEVTTLAPRVSQAAS